MKSSVISSTSLFDKPAGWEDKDYEGEIKKLEKEAEDRLEAKIAEMAAKLETTGSK